ncbi:adenylylsulfatase HINT3 isoform X1 [Cucurbita maxima]|uniref:Adenylylsulfatase HINT3 isoform X1 n=1 Tax=Cucurbita maxima TaxID=3661 RepID=A0A6J1KVS3_CUCMA|nr:adenylylsulfatase HINT3 isoform X1 [Cucurbita maxima]
MEARRLAILCSHLRPINSGHSRAPPSHLSSSNCASVAKSEQVIYDPHKGSLQDGCVFCRIILGEEPAFKLYEDDSCLCILDTRPLSNGHSLIIPKSHYSSLEATPPSVIAAMCSKVPLISNAIMKSTGSDSFNLLVNNGVAAGQVIFHTHIHIIPRKARDCLWESESLQRRTLKFDEEASRLAESIQEMLHSTKENDSSKVQESNLSGN